MPPRLDLVGPDANVDIDPNSPEVSFAGSSPSTSTGSPSVPVHPGYEKLLAYGEDIGFLFTTRFTDTIKDSVSEDSIRLKFNVTVDQGIEELRRFLAIKVFVRDYDASKVSPTPLMDEIWHATILDTRLYKDLQHALQCVIEHRPSGASHKEAEVRRTRLVTMQALYSIYFLTNPLGSMGAQSATSAHPYATDGPNRQAKRVYPATLLTSSSMRNNKRHQSGSVKINVITLTGKRLPGEISYETSITNLKYLVQGMEGMPADQQTLVFAGKELEDGKTVQEYGIKDGAIINIVLRLSGC